tara:strand:- start:137 stop:1249 length:1113 start_codon:yes stop_codon:yes gene_type:complete
MAISKIPSAGFQDNVKFRNIIINGDMSIAQRGTSVTGLGNGDNGYHTCDRWRFGEGGTPTYVFSQSQSTDVPSGQGFAKSLKMDCTTAQGSLGSGTALRIQQRIEGQNLQYLKKGTANAESLTCSFWVKSNKTGTYTLEIADADNSRFNSKTYTISSANTWEKKTITYDGDTTGTLDNDNSYSFVLHWFLGAGTDFTSGTFSNGTWGTTVDANRASSSQVNLADSTSNEWYITGVQLEAGETASDFEFLPYDVNAQRCLRYYEGGDDNSVTFGKYRRFCEVLADGNTSRLKIFSGSFSVIKRATPTITLYAGTSFTTSNRISRYDASATTETVTSISSKTANAIGTYLNVSTTAGAGQTYQFNYEADAEL